MTNLTTLKFIEEYCANQIRCWVEVLPSHQYVGPELVHLVVYSTLLLLSVQKYTWDYTSSTSFGKSLPRGYPL